MPLGKRLLVLAAVLAALAPLAGGLLWALAGEAARGLGLAAAGLAAGLGALHVFWPPFDLGLGSLRRGPRGARRVALTFDDGPSEDTPAVLDALGASGARATFFVLGRHAERWPEHVREMARRGHEVALHGHSHRRLAAAGPGTVAREIDAGAEAIRRAGVEPAPWFRAPHGWKGPFLGPALRRRGLRLVGWTRGVWDTARPGPAAIVARATARPAPGEILLLHDGCGTPGIDPRRDQTAAAVPEIVRRWRAAGYDFVTVGELAAGDRPRAGGRALRVAGLALLVVLAAFALARVDLAAVGATLRRARPGWLALAVLSNCASLATHAGRWRAVVLSPGGRPRYRDALSAIVSGFAAGLVLPGRGGDLVRSHLLARRAGLSTAAVVAAAALDYLVGTVTMVAALGAVALAAPLPGWGARALVLSAAAAAAGAAAAFLLRPARGAAAGPPGDGLLARLRHGLAALHDGRALGVSAAWGIAGWLAEGGIAWCTLRALDLPSTAVVAAVVVLAASAASAVGVAPANAGTFEVATVVALAGFGVPSGAGVAFALAFHAVHVLPVAVLGGAALLREGIGAEGLARGEW